MVKRATVTIRLVLQQWCLFLPFPPQINLAQPITESTLRLITEKRSSSTGFGISSWIPLNFPQRSKINVCGSLFLCLFVCLFFNETRHWLQSRCIAPLWTERWRLPVPMTALTYQKNLHPINLRQVSYTIMEVVSL